MRSGRTGKRSAGQLVLAAAACALALSAPGLLSAFQAPGGDSVLAIPVAWFHGLFVVPAGLAIIVIVIAKRFKRLRP